MTDLLDLYNAPKNIEYLSLTTEGSEIEILKSLNLKKYMIYYIHVSHNFIENYRKSIHSLLLSHGYLYFNENNNNDEYIHDTIIIGKFTVGNIIINVTKNTDNVFLATIDNVNYATGVYNNGSIHWLMFGKGKIYYNYIDFGNKNVWKKII